MKYRDIALFLILRNFLQGPAMNILKLILISIALLMLGFFIVNNFIKASVEEYQATQPQIDVKEYFNGPIKAWGVIQDWRGKVVTKFDIDMVGHWDGDQGTLKEHFQYYDGRTQEREWKITKLGQNQYEGTASDIIGKATGKTQADVAKWSYVMDLSIQGKNYHITFDDWMWNMNDGVVINRSYLKKFGITVAELTIFMKKSQ